MISEIIFMLTVCQVHVQAAWSDTSPFNDMNRRPQPFNCVTFSTELWVKHRGREVFSGKMSDWVLARCTTCKPVIIKQNVSRSEWTCLGSLCVEGGAVGVGV